MNFDFRVTVLSRVPSFEFRVSVSSFGFNLRVWGSEVALLKIDEIVLLTNLKLGSELGTRNSELETGDRSSELELKT